jgi:CheY-like chemotaxis protein
MKLATQSAAIGISEKLSLVERAAECCRRAKELERAGEYEVAREALSVFWPERGESPMVEGLDRRNAAEVFLRVGVVMGLLGGAHQLKNQEAAKDLITSSIEIFTELADSQRVAEAQSDLALCYWREGGFDEARVNLTQALDRVTDDNGDLKALILLRAAEVERSAGCLNDALRFVQECAPRMDESQDFALKGPFHNTFALVLDDLASAENRIDYRDKALIEFAAASFHFEQAGHARYCAGVENNLGFLYQSIGKFPEAHEHIDRARHIFLSLGDVGHVAQVNDTRARAFLAEGRLQDAERYARMAVKTLDRGDECSLLVEALTTHGVALARLGNFSAARSELDRAIEAGENCGDLEGAGRARLSIIEELSGQTSAREMAPIFKSALETLKRSQDPSAIQRLFAASATVIDAYQGAEFQGTDLTGENLEGFSFKQELQAYEKILLERALREAGGSVTKASRLLGFKHHQSLISLINTRHQELLQTRSAVRKRRRPIVSKPKASKKTVTPKPSARQISVLHVEDNKQVANELSEILGSEGMEVKTCGHGLTALKWLADETRFDVVIVDNDLPGLGGLELVRRVRKITHRRKTPIIMLSSDDIETEAWGAGVQEFLRKPEDMNRVAATVTRLLRRAKDK